MTPRLRGALLLVPAAFAPAAVAFTVEVGEIVTLLPVQVQATALDRAVVVRVINAGDSPASCELVLDTGPEELTRRIDIPPGEVRVLNRAVRPTTQKVRIRGTCT